jgi:para-nitrobenzyl esterase
MTTRERILRTIALALGFPLAVSAAVVPALASASASAQAAAACADGTDVSTASGPVCGIVAGGVREWLGIPYAAPPVGRLRWQPPQPHARWTPVLHATQFGSECVQGTAASLAGSENCLFLNVTEPSAPAAGPLPVVVNIHPSGFLAGNGNGDYSLLATSGHEIVVSVNYRMGIFGFLADSALGPHSGDYGLEDQQAALRWVRRDIGAFGGNPHDVTVTGESAGGTSVCDLLASPTAAGLFQKAITVSGEYSNLLGRPSGTAFPLQLEIQDCKSTLPTQRQADQIGTGFAAAAGCGQATDLATCLRGLSAAAATKAAGAGYQFGGHGTLAPTLNGTTLPRTFRQALITGTVNRVPVMAGVSRDENLVGEPTTGAQYAQLVRAQYGSLAARVLALYPVSRFPSPFVAWRTVAADSDTVCPALSVDRALSRWTPVYGFEMDDGNAPPSYYEPAGEPNGSFHVADWYVYTAILATPTDPDERVLQDQEVAEVAAFSRTGQPSALAMPSWPEFGRSGAVMSLAPGADSQLTSAQQISADHNCGFWNGITPAA